MWTGSASRYEEDSRARVAQVDRGSCALIFSDQWPEKVGKGLMFISLNVEPETHEAAVAALDALRAEFEARDVPVRDGRLLGAHEHEVKEHDLPLVR
jgi:hypothetical protein